MPGGDSDHAQTQAKSHIVEAAKRLPRFPGDCPDLHQGRLWMEALDDEVRSLRLQPILN